MPLQGMRQMPGTGDGRRTVRVAVALVVVAAASVLFDLAGYLWLLTPWSLGSLDPDESTLIAVGVVLIVVALVSFALWLASVVLSILVLVWGRGALRLGALFVLVPVTISTFVSVDISGDFEGADAARSVLGVIGMVADLAGIALVVAGIVLLLRGIREARRM